jgi:hypothetical protein
MELERCVKLADPCESEYRETHFSLEKAFSDDTWGLEDFPSISRDSCFAKMSFCDKALSAAFRTSCLISSPVFNLNCESGASFI